MGMHAIGRFIDLVDEVQCADDLLTAMVEVCATLGFQYFALTHHVDMARAAPSAIRLHNYPDKWADYYDANALGVSDPVHRASHVTSVGFRWSRMPEMIPLTATDKRVLLMGREQGIGDGFTVPANVPGETRGSCSFANEAGHGVPDAMLPMAQLAGAFAFESARRLWSIRKLDGNDAPPVLTDRQRDCVLWTARGKGDWEISRILGISEETVARHIKQACERYGVNKRTLLAIRTLFDGTLTFTDIFRP
jgi:DNA-binding CsgD family transcriptional regulator